jgi:endonuclease YncB( thermonuclease family)
LYFLFHVFLFGSFGSSRLFSPEHRDDKQTTIQKNMGSCISSHSRQTASRLRNLYLVDLNTMAKTDPKIRFGLTLEDILCKVVKVYDGDSLTLAWLDPRTKRIQYSNCRIAGVDTPELRSPNAEEKAAAYACQRWLSDLVMDEFMRVTTVGARGLDKYGRPLVSLRADPQYSSPKLIERMKESELCVLMKAADLPMLRLMDQNGKVIIA